MPAKSATALRQHDTATLVDWLLSVAAYQGISDAAANAYAAVHGAMSYSEIQAALASRPSCPRLRGYWTFSGCGYRKATGRCAELLHRPLCPLPRHALRKGSLNVAGCALCLFARDTCNGDLVGWIDARLAAADAGEEAPDRSVRMRKSLVEPLVNIAGFGPKIWSMALADLFLGGDPERERWVTTGAAMVAIDSLVHAFLHRSGILRRLEVEHLYGPGCYGPSGCVAVIEGLANRFDARQINPAFPQNFPRLVQHALWRFCAAGGFNLKVDDRFPCHSRFCPAGSHCDRVALRPPACI